MKVLLDESCPVQLRAHLAHHETFTTVYAGFGAFKNGALLKAAEAAAFDVLVTADKTLQYEQNLAGRKLALVSISANSWKVIGPNVAKIVAGGGFRDAGIIHTGGLREVCKAKTDPGAGPGIGLTSASQKLRKKAPVSLSYRSW
jgi:hypothetical protein